MNAKYRMLNGDVLSCCHDVTSVQVVTNSTLSTKRLKRNYAHAKSYDSEEMFIEHPQFDSGKLIVDRTLQARVKTVFVLHAKANHSAPSRGTPVLMLHGAKFSTATWEQTGTIAALTEEGFEVKSHLEIQGTRSWWLLVAFWTRF